MSDKHAGRKCWRKLGKMRLTVVQHPERMWKKEVVPEPKSYKISFLNSYGKCRRIIFMYTHFALDPCNIPIFERRVCLGFRGNARVPTWWSTLSSSSSSHTGQRISSGYINEWFQKQISLSLSLSLSLSIFSLQTQPNNWIHI